MSALQPMGADPARPRVTTSAVVNNRTVVHVMVAAVQVANTAGQQRQTLVPPPNHPLFLEARVGYSPVILLGSQGYPAR
ncbi:MAG: putative MAPEG superfamily protein [Myxococcota bacterium]|jgi:uncharacterized MAPEG superfamily protein